MATKDQLQRVALELLRAETGAAYATRRRFLAAVLAAPTLAAAQALVWRQAGIEQRTVAELNRLAAKGGLATTTTKHGG